MVSPLAFLAAGVSAIAVALLVRTMVPPPRSLASRIRPYLAPALGVRAEVRGGSVVKVFGPIVRQLAESGGKVLERSGDQVTILKLRQAGWYRSLPEEEMVSAYRVAQLRSIVIGCVFGATAGLGARRDVVLFVILIGLGLIVGATRQRARIEKAIETRRELMRIEVYTVNQLSRCGSEPAGE